MCGILAIMNSPTAHTPETKNNALALAKLLRHRGPDWSGCIVSGKNILCHERLAIVGIGSGSQPLTNEGESLILTVNGEIYNHVELRSRFINPEAKFKTASDCEVIIHLYDALGPSFVSHLRGMFSFVLYDVKKDFFLVARDPIGITTLYYGRHSKFPGTFYVASELKALQKDCDEIQVFPPGHIYNSETGKFVPFFRPDWWDIERIPTSSVDLSVLREALETAVRRRLMTEVPFGVLLSGGLDSSLIASITVREFRRSMQDSTNSLGLRDVISQVNSFSIGLEGSPDLKAAQEVADFIGTKHDSFVFTLQEAHDALLDVIYHLETADVTTIRASTPMYLLSRRIKSLGFKMVLSGEGSDEVFGGYLYFHAAPTPRDFHQECVTRVQNLHLSDCLRANKSTMAWGLEARVPFLDTDFLQVAMNIDPMEKQFGDGKIEKYILRKAFDDPDQPYLPPSILWRQKEQFSDGVGYGWIDSLKDAAEAAVSDEMFDGRFKKWPLDTPDTKEAYWYRVMFDSLFPSEAAAGTMKRWIPRADWGCSKDPSGRAQKVHLAAYDVLPNGAQH